MKNKKNKNNILKYTISFISGIMVVLFVMKIINVENTQAYEVINPVIAIVNQDVVGDEYDFSFGDKIVEMFEDNDAYSFVLTNYEDAQKGVKGYAYSGYILIDSSFTNSMYSINTEVPIKGKISYKINSNLDNEAKKQVEDYILSQIYLINNNINYLYISSILEVLHGSQDTIEEVLLNESEVDRILYNIDGYNSKYYESSDEFLKQAQENEDNSSDVGEENEFVFDPTSLIDFKIDTDKLNEIKNNLKQGYVDNLKSLSEGFEVIFSEYGSSILNNNIFNEGITFDDMYLDILNNGTDKIVRMNNKIDILSSIFTRFDTLPLHKYENTVIFFDDMYKYATEGDIVSFQEQMSSSIFQFIVTFIEDFHTSYIYWTTNASRGCSDDRNCMKPFIDKYEPFEVIQDYIVLKNSYLAILDFIDSPTYTLFKNGYTNYVNSLNGAYLSFKDQAPYNTLKEGYDETEKLCLNLDSSNENMLTYFACGWNEYLKFFAQEYLASKREYDNVLLDYVVEQDVEVVKLVADNKNISLQRTVETSASVITEVTNSVSQVFSPDKVESLQEKAEDIHGNIGELESSLGNNEIKNQKKINEITKEVSKIYPELADNIAENSDLLYDFATLFENSKNAEGSNYFLYDFVSNPIKVNKEEENQKLIPIENNINKKDELVLLGLTLSMAMTVGIYYDMRKRYKGDNRSDEK